MGYHSDREVVVVEEEEVVGVTLLEDGSLGVQEVVSVPLAEEWVCE